MNELEPFLLEIMEAISSRFDKHAVLRGGMVLRALGCDRFTNDVDYVFLPYRSKKDVVEAVEKSLQSLPNVSITSSLNSKCLRIMVTRDEKVAQVEIKVAEKVKTQTISNRELVQDLPLPVRLLPVVDYSVAMADKLAAWNERRLIRDIYDVWFFCRIGVSPDKATLKARLQKPVYSTRVKNQKKFPANQPLDSFYEFFRESVLQLEDADIQEELSGLLPQDALPGLAMKFRAEFASAF